MSAGSHEGDELRVATQAARAGGAELRDRFSKPRTVSYKSNTLDLVTDADAAAEARIIQIVSAAFPRDAILAEESGAHTGSGGRRWLIDPLDGTTNYAHGVPHFAVSIGFEQDGELRVGVVYDPMRDELFTAEHGQGAWLNGAPMKVSAVERTDLAMLATGFPYWLKDRPDDLLALFSSYVRAAQSVRRFGSAALDLAWVAAGRYDGFFELGLKPWDVAAGIVLVACSGGRVSGLDGQQVRVDAGQICASNGALHDALLALSRFPTPT